MQVMLPVTLPETPGIIKKKKKKGELSLQDVSILAGLSASPFTRERSGRHWSDRDVAGRALIGWQGIKPAPRC